jgi:hypothetical protein
MKGTGSRYPVWASTWRTSDARFEITNEEVEAVKERLFAHWWIDKLQTLKLMPRAWKMTCLLCRKRAHYWHHLTYSWPEDVVPVCGACHRLAHTNEAIGPLLRRLRDR